MAGAAPEVGARRLWIGEGTRTIAERARTIADRARTIAERTRTIAERARTIARLGEALVSTGAALKANGFTSATMAKEAKELSDLRTQVQAAKSALVQASAALGARSEEFATLWASYSNLVRALTTDVALRRKHGAEEPRRAQRADVQA